MELAELSAFQRARVELKNGEFYDLHPSWQWWERPGSQGPQIHHKNRETTCSWSALQGPLRNVVNTEVLKEYIQKYGDFDDLWMPWKAALLLSIPRWCDICDHTHKCSIISIELYHFIIFSWSFLSYQDFHEAWPCEGNRSQTVWLCDFQRFGSSTALCWLVSAQSSRCDRRDHCQVEASTLSDPISSEIRWNQSYWFTSISKKSKTSPVKLDPFSFSTPESANLHRKSTWTEDWEVIQWRFSWDPWTAKHWWSWCVFQDPRFLWFVPAWCSFSSFFHFFKIRFSFIENWLGKWADFFLIVVQVVKIF